MTICFFGLYARAYTRNRIFLRGLHQNNVQIIECNDRSHLIYGLRYLKLTLKFFQLRSWRADIIFVGFPGQTDVPLAWVFGKLFGKKIVFDAFYSVYVSQVFDRKSVSENSFKAKIYWFTDWLSCFLADRVTLDTNTQIDYFVQTFKLPRRKFSRVLVGTDTEVIKPVKSKPHTGFIVGFHGSFLPLQGVPVILQAAKILQDKKINFKLLGNGIEFARCHQIVIEQKIKNVEFLKEVPYEQLANFISSTDLYLGGPFGASLKSSHVIPNKVYESMATKKAVIVGDSQATRELFDHKITCYFVPQGNPEKLAAAILDLKNNTLMREKIARGGYNLIHKELTPKKIASELVSVVEASHEHNF